MTAIFCYENLASFAPDPERARYLDARAHTELSSSLRHLSEVTAQALPGESALLAKLAGRVAQGRRLPSLAFATYFEIAHLLMQNNGVEAQDAVARLAAFPARAAGLTILRYGEASAAPLERQLSTGISNIDLPLASVDEELGDQFTELIEQGLELMRSTIPALHGEVTTLVREVLLAQSPEASEAQFDGASHYQFWGLLMLNPTRHRDLIEVVEVLAHESAHSLLFGLTVEEPLVFNPDDELFRSPLRVDPRPMDGIYHATYVSARMAWAMERLADSDALTPEQREKAAAAVTKDRENFAAGDNVVRQYGRLSETGAEIMANARDYIAAA